MSTGNGHTTSSRPHPRRPLKDPTKVPKGLKKQQGGYEWPEDNNGKVIDTDSGGVITTDKQEGWEKEPDSRDTETTIASLCTAIYTRKVKKKASSLQPKTVSTSTGVKILKGCHSG
jgi:hypothetical protein